MFSTARKINIALYVLPFVFVLAIPLVFATASFGNRQTLDNTSFAGASDVVAVDLDQDGDDDAVAIAYASSDLNWYSNNGSESFTETDISTSLSAPIELAVADMEPDGDLDIFVADYGASDILWFRNNGSQSFTKLTISGTYLSAFAVYPHDIDDDGDTDVLGAARSGNNIYWWENDGNENFTARMIKGSWSGARDVMAIDIDADGDEDVVATAFIDDDVSLFLNNGSETFSETVIDGNFDNAHRVDVDDLDGDGDLDIVASSGLEGISWWAQDGSHNFGAQQVVVSNANFDAPDDVEIIDVDVDGDMDIISVSQDDDDVAWFENDGSESFTERTVDSSFDEPYGVDGHDIDDDGDIDIFAAAYGAGSSSLLAWWQQSGSTAPDLSALSPNDNAYHISTTSNLSITFDEIVQGGTGTITIKKSSDDSTVETINANNTGLVSGSGTTQITINPATTLSTDTDYYVLIHANAFRDISGQYYAGISAATTWNFTTTDTIYPSLSTLSPTDGSTGNSQTANLVITFSEIVRGGTGTIIIKKASDDSTIESIAGNNATYVSGSGSTTITINPASTFTAYTDYYVTVHANAFKDKGGNHYAGFADTGTWNFTTGDVTNPTVSTLSPADNATGVSNTANLVITFSEAVQGGTGTVVIKKTSDNSTVETITANDTTYVSGSGTTQITINPTTALAASTSYYVLINKNAFQDAYGLDYAGYTSTTTWNFTTHATDSTKPLVWTFSPADNATGVSTTANLVVTFDEVVQGGTGTVVIKKSSDDSTIETITTNNTSLVSGSGSTQITINPDATLVANTSYYVIINKNAFQDSRGNDYVGYSATTTWNFTTADNTAPSLSTLSPTDNATGVSGTANLVITFDEAVQGGTGTIVIKKTSDDSTIESIAGNNTTYVSGTGTTSITINPATTLAALVEYYVIINKNAFQDAFGNDYAGFTSTTTWSFTTTDTTAPSLSTLSPADGATDVAITANLVMTFDEAVQGGTGSVVIKKSSDNSTIETITANGGLVTGTGTAIITIDPSVSLSNDTNYYINVGANAFQDGYGNDFAGISNNSTWNFTTIASSSSSSSSESGGGGGGGGGGSGLRFMNVPGVQTVIQGRLNSQPTQTGAEDESWQPGPVAGVFRDVKHGDWYTPAISRLKAMNVIHGYKDAEGNETDRFGPSNPVTFAELSKLIVLLTSRMVEHEEQSTYWADEYLKKARELGLSLYVDPALKPDAPATRGAVILTALEAFAIPYSAPSASVFSDLPESHPQADAILKAYLIGVVKGDDLSDGTAKVVRPDDTINRAEVAKILIELFDRFPIPDESLVRQVAQRPKAVLTDAIHSAPVQYPIGTYSVNTPKLNLRADSRIDGTVLLELRKGNTMDVLRIVHEDWAYVRLPNGREGYVWFAHLAKD